MCFAAFFVAICYIDILRQLRWNKKDWLMTNKPFFMFQTEINYFSGAKKNFCVYRHQCYKHKKDILMKYRCLAKLFSLLYQSDQIINFPRGTKKCFYPKSFVYTFFRIMDFNVDLKQYKLFWYFCNNFCSSVAVFVKLFFLFQNYFNNLSRVFFLKISVYKMGNNKTKKEDSDLEFALELMVTWKTVLIEEWLKWKTTTLKNGLGKRKFWLLVHRYFTHPVSDFSE